MNKWNVITVILVILGFLFIITGVALEIREMFIDHYCYELAPYEFNNTPMCEKYRKKYKENK